MTNNLETFAEEPGERSRTAHMMIWDPKKWDLAASRVEETPLALSAR